jgi:hypothetical protein
MFYLVFASRFATAVNSDLAIQNAFMLLLAFVACFHHFSAQNYVKYIYLVRLQNSKQIYQTRRTILEVTQQKIKKISSD